MIKAGKVSQKGSARIENGKVVVDWVQFEGCESSEDYCIICGNMLTNNKMKFGVELSFMGEVINYEGDNGEEIHMPYATETSQGWWSVGSECYKEIKKLCKQVIAETHNTGGKR